MIDKVSKYLHRIGVEHDIYTNEKALSFDVETPQGTWQCSVLVDKKAKTRNGIGFYSTLPVKVPIGLLNQMALFLMCLNNDRLFGNFELDPATGDIRFKTYLDFENRAFSEKAVERNMLINISIMQKYMPSLMKMIHCV